MSDHKDDGISPLEYLISALVILSFGLLYFFINHGFSFWSDAGKDAMLPAAPVVQDVVAVKQAGDLSADDNSPDDEVAVDNQAEKQVAEANQKLAAAQEDQGSLQSEIDKQGKEQQAEVKALKGQLDEERQGSEEVKRELAAVKQQLAEEMERNKAARNQLEEALSLQSQPKEIPEPTLQRPEPKRQVFNLPDGTEIPVSDNGFEGAVKAAMVKHTLNKPMLFDSIQFESGSSKLRKSSENQIRVVAALMNTYKDIKVLIRGHTDSKGEVNANSLLSLTRSDKMKKQLIGLGIDKQRVKIEGIGESEPLASNDTEEGRSKNRRIELILIE